MCKHPLRLHTNVHLQEKQKYSKQFGFALLILFCYRVKLNCFNTSFASNRTVCNFNSICIRSDKHFKWKLNRPLHLFNKFPIHPFITNIYIEILNLPSAE